MKSRAKMLLAAAAAVALVTTMSTATEAASAAPSASGSTLTTLTATGSVTTADKHVWTLSLQYLSFGSVGVLEAVIRRTISSAGGGFELHTWAVPMKGSALTFSTSSRKGSLNTGTAANPLASAKLSFTGTAPRKVSCSSGRETDYPGSLSGKFTLNTGLSKGGTIGSSALRFSSATIGISNSCDPTASARPCASGVDFSADDSASLLVDGVSSATDKSATVGVTRAVSLKAPLGAVRTDAAGLAAGPLPVFDAKKQTLTVRTESSGALTGSAVLSGGHKSPSGTPCSVGTKKYTLVEASYTGVKLTSPKTARLTAHTTLSGTITAPVTLTGAAYDIITRRT